MAHRYEDRRNIEDTLRRARPRPSDGYVRELAERVAPRRPARPLRLGLAAGMTSLLIGMLGAFGQLGYAASGIGNAFTSLISSGPTHSSFSAADAQYEKPPTPEQLVVRKLHARVAAAHRALQKELAAAHRKLVRALRKCHSSSCSSSARQRYQAEVRTFKKRFHAALKRDKKLYQKELKKVRGH